MTRELTRGHLEALLVARALVLGDAGRFLAGLDRARMSSAVLVLLERMGAPAHDDVERGPTSKAQRDLADRARAVTVWELMQLSERELFAKCKRLPFTARPRTSVAHVGLEVA